MAGMKFEIVGLKDIEEALKELPKATGRRVARDVLIEAGTVVADQGRSNAPLGPTGNLKGSYGVGTKLTRRQAGLHVKQSPVEVFVGPNDPAAIQTEFGNEHQAAEPHLRPAWDATKMRVLNIIAYRLEQKITASVARRRKRLAAKGI